MGFADFGTESKGNCYADSGCVKVEAEGRGWQRLQPSTSVGSSSGMQSGKVHLVR